MKPVVISRRAEREIDETYRYYESLRTGQDEDFLQRIRLMLANLSRLPQMSSVVALGARRAVVHGYPYALIYRDLERHVQVAALFPTRANPKRLTRLTDPRH